MLWIAVGVLFGILLIAIVAAGYAINVLLEQVRMLHSDHRVSYDLYMHNMRDLVNNANARYDKLVEQMAVERKLVRDDTKAILEAIPKVPVGQQPVQSSPVDTNIYDDVLGVESDTALLEKWLAAEPPPTLDDDAGKGSE